MVCFTTFGIPINMTEFVFSGSIVDKVKCEKSWFLKLVVVTKSMKPRGRRKQFQYCKEVLQYFQFD